MGSHPPLGYDVRERRLVVNEPEAETVRSIFRRFLTVGSATILARTLAAEGTTTKRGRTIDKGDLYKILNNRVYVGEAVHKGVAYPGEHEAIVDRDLWDKVHTILSENARTRSAYTRAQTPALLKGLVFGPTGCAMTPTHTRRRGRLYRYYVSQTVLKQGAQACPVRRVPAGQIEAAVVDQLRAVFRQPEIVVGTWRQARTQEANLPEAEMRLALQRLDPLWDELFPAEQARIVQLLVDRVDVSLDGIDIRLRVEGLEHLVGEMATHAHRRAA